MSDDTYARVCAAGVGLGYLSADLRATLERFERLTANERRPDDPALVAALDRVTAPLRTLLGNLDAAAARCVGNRERAAAVESVGGDAVAWQEAEVAAGLNDALAAMRAIDGDRRDFYATETYRELTALPLGDEAQQCLTAWYRLNERQTMIRGAMGDIHEGATTLMLQRTYRAELEEEGMMPAARAALEAEIADASLYPDLIRAGAGLGAASADLGVTVEAFHRSAQYGEMDPARHADAPPAATRAERNATIAPLLFYQDELHRSIARVRIAGKWKNDRALPEVRSALSEAREIFVGDIREARGYFYTSSERDAIDGAVIPEGARRVVYEWYRDTPRDMNLGQWFRDIADGVSAIDRHALAGLSPGHER